MADIFDYPVLPEMPFLEELADELEGTFLVVAFRIDKDLDYVKRYIKVKQSYISRRFGRFLPLTFSDVAVFHIEPAYNTLQELLDGDPTLEEIRQRAEECLNEHIIGGEPSEDYLTVFQAFY